MACAQFKPSIFVYAALKYQKTCVGLARRFFIIEGVMWDAARPCKVILSCQENGKARDTCIRGSDYIFFVFETKKRKMNPAYNFKRQREEDDVQPNAKRRQLDGPEWKREDLKGGCTVDPSRAIFFVDMTRKEYQDFVVRGGSQSPKVQRFNNGVKFHANGEPLSVCYQYVLWLHPDASEENTAFVHSQYNDIESWSNPSGQFFFRQEPFNMLGLPADLQQMALKFMTPADTQKSLETHAIFRAKQKRVCESVTFNFLDPHLEDSIKKWRMECMLPTLKIKKVVVEGPLAFQEPAVLDSLDLRWQRYKIIAELLALAENVTFKSVEATELSQAYDSLFRKRRWERPKSIYVEELKVGPATYEQDVNGEGENMRFVELAKMFKSGVLNADRWVYGKRNEDTIEQLQDTLAVQKTIFPIDRPIYMAVDETNDEALFDIENLGIRNYIVPTRFLVPPNDAFRSLIQTAQNVIYRPFNDDLMAVA